MQKNLPFSVLICNIVNSRSFGNFYSFKGGGTPHCGEGLVIISQTPIPSQRQISLGVSPSINVKKINALRTSNCIE